MVTLEEYISAMDQYVSNIFMCTIDEMAGRSRKREIVSARQICMYVFRQYTNMSLARIGQHYNKDHATVLHALKTVANIRDTDRIYKKIVDNIIAVAGSYDVDIPHRAPLLYNDYMDEDMALYASL